MVTLISYDLKQSGRDYSSLFEAIESYKVWSHPLESIWLVDSERTPGEIRDHLNKHIVDNDNLFVVRLRKSWGSTRLTKEAIEWLKNANRTW